jgi:hypothetical protein
MGGAIGLLRVAAAAEMLRWRLLARRGITRVFLLVAAIVFLCAALAMLHVVALVELSPRIGTSGTAASLLGVDLVIGLVLMLVAARLGPGAAERDALALRQSVHAELERKAELLRLLAKLVEALRRR